MAKKKVKKFVVTPMEIMYMNKVYYIPYKTYREEVNGKDVWFRCFKNVQSNHKDFGLFINDVPDYKVKKYFK
jgi:hypothetical protein